MFDAGGVLRMSPDRHHVTDDLLELALGRADDA